MKASKGIRGWSVEEEITINGEDWYITTMKRADGFIRCSAVKLDPPNLEGLRSYGAMNEKHMLFENRAKATEKNVNDVHAVGLRKLKEILES